MTSHQRYARACTLAALHLGAGAIACYSAPIPAAALAYGAALLAWCANREYTAHRRVLAEHEWARRRALGEQPPPLTPCCLLWVYSDGKVHDGRRCTCPRDARTSLSRAEEDAFELLTAQFDHPDDHRNAA